MDNDAVMRTLEVVIAVVLSLIVLLAVVPSRSVNVQGVNIPYCLVFDSSFRNAVLSGNSSLVKKVLNNSVFPMFPDYDFDVSVSSSPDYVLSLNVPKDVYSKTFFISSNLTNFGGYFVRIYYWKK